mmetsp:Transcript_693/g.1805  ORF Transcript_693/g.1805 Transcript_693/m.1805 type:complete len:837 (-) Transcript_693:169-2679(-)
MTSTQHDVSERSEGRVDEPSFAEAMQAVNAVLTVSHELRAEKESVDDAVLLQLEGAQIREDYGSEHAADIREEEARAAEAAASGEDDRLDSGTIPISISTGSLAESILASDKELFEPVAPPPPMLARIATGRTPAKGNGRSSGADSTKKPSAKPSADEEVPSRVRWRKRIKAGFSRLPQELLRLLLLAPFVLGMVGHRDEHVELWPQWEVWFGRPLYLLVLSRVLVGVLFKLSEVVGAIEALPPRVTMLATAFEGTPAITIVWLSLWPAARALPLLDQDAWTQLERLPWRIGLNLLIGVAAASYALLQASLSGALSHLRSRHFEERVQQTVLSLRMVRILFHEARAISQRRHKNRGRGASRGRSVGVNSLHPSGSPRKAAKDSHKPLPLNGAGQGTEPKEAQHAPVSRADTDSEDGGLFDASIFSLGGQYAVIVETMGLGLLKTLSDTRKKARRAFQLFIKQQEEEAQTAASAAQKAIAQAATAAKPTSATALLTSPGAGSTEGGGSMPQPTLSRSILERLCADAALKRTGGEKFSKQLRTHVVSLFTNATLTEDEFVNAIERVYKEQRLVRASIDSFDLVHGRIRSVATVVWALLAGIALVFIPDWGTADFSENFVVPIATSAFSVVYALGWLPYETVSGALFAVYIRPYDIGDRVVLGQPGAELASTQYIVTEIWLTYCRLVDAVTGKSHVMMNHILRKLDVVNLNRSASATYVLLVEVPASTSVMRISELIDAVRTYITEASSDWTGASAAVDSASYSKGYLTLEFGLNSAHAAHEVGAYWKARSQVMLFIHEYMLAAGIEYTQPPQPLVAMTPGGRLGPTRNSAASHTPSNG